MNKKPPKPHKTPKAVVLKRLKKACLSLWSELVRERDGHKCLLCGKTENLTAHHWCVPKRGHEAFAYNPMNGATLCYACHIHRVHREDSTYSLSNRIRGEVEKKVYLKFHVGGDDFETFMRHALADGGKPRPFDVTVENYSAIRTGLSMMLGANPSHYCKRCAKELGHKITPTTEKTPDARCSHCGKVTTVWLTPFGPTPSRDQEEGVLAAIEATYQKLNSKTKGKKK